MLHSHIFAGSRERKRRHEESFFFAPLLKIILLHFIIDTYIWYLHSNSCQHFWLEVCFAGTFESFFAPLNQLIKVNMFLLFASFMPKFRGIFHFVCMRQISRASLEIIRFHELCGGWLKGRRTERCSKNRIRANGLFIELKNAITTIIFLHVSGSQFKSNFQNHVLQNYTQHKHSV